VFDSTHPEKVTQTPLLLPPIDLAVPEKLEIATFANG